MYPNNRTRIYDLSITPENPKTPDFKVSTKYFQVENGVRWGRLGDTDEYFWETEEEQRANDNLMADIDDQYSHHFDHDNPNK